MSQCLLCGSKIRRRQMGIHLAGAEPYYRHRSYHAVCIQDAGGALLLEARELWADLHHLLTWDDMIADQRLIGSS